MSAVKCGSTLPIRQQAAQNRAIAPALQLTRYLSFAISDT